MRGSPLTFDFSGGGKGRDSILFWPPLIQRRGCCEEADYYYQWPIKDTIIAGRLKDVHDRRGMIASNQMPQLKNVVNLFLAGKVGRGRESLIPLNEVLPPISAENTDQNPTP